MDLSRRDFLKVSAVAGATGASGVARHARAEHISQSSGEWYGVLVDTTVCVGCRKCEWACNKANNLPAKGIAEFEDQSVFAKMRRPHAEAVTVVNRYENPANPAKPYHVKVQCMHCNDPACVSACIVGAITKDPKTGAVNYDASKCIGCRYCMAACPFQIPAYEYENALAPQMRKCSFCFETITEKGGVPACVGICPMEALTFGKRDELIQIGRSKIAAEPDKYIEHIYGEKELGGTSWMYLSGKPMEELGLLKFGERPIPSYTEPLQHGIFKYFVPPLSLFALLGGVMWLFKKEDQNNAKKGGK